MKEIAAMLIQQFMMQRQKYSQTLVYVSIVAGVAYVASNGVDLSLVVG